MSFNLTQPWSKTDVIAMLASVEDDRNWRILIQKNGQVVLWDVTHGKGNLDQMHAYFETYVGGNGYVGAAAAADARHVEDITNKLIRNWPELEHDAYLDH